MDGDIRDERVELFAGVGDLQLTLGCWQAELPYAQILNATRGQLDAPYVRVSCC